MREPGFDLAAAIARPGFTPAVKDAGALVALLEQGDEAVTRHATRGLVALRGAGRDALLRRLGAGASDDARTPGQLEEGAATRLIAALGALARGGDAAATRALLPLVTAPSERWRRAAVVALGKLGGDAARGRRDDVTVGDAASGAAIDAASGAAIDEARAAVLSRWDAAELSAAERRALTEAMGKLGGGAAVDKLAALATGDDAELARRRDRALLMSRRDQSRASEASLATSEDRPTTSPTGRAEDGAPPASHVDPSAVVPQMRLAWACRGGMGPLLAEELGGLGHRVVEREVDGVVTLFSGALGAVFASRLWTQLGLLVPLASSGPPSERGARGERTDESPALAREITATLCQPSVRALLGALTRGAVRWRLEMASGGPRRALVWQVVRDVAKQAPELVNEPADTTWTVTVDERRRALLLRPRRLEDPRFAWRQQDLPSASHPTVAAAVAAMGKPRGGERVWDPFTGSGSELIECAIAAARAGGPPLALVGTDLDPEALAAAARNTAAAGVTATLERADARGYRPAGGGATVDLIASNPPLGGRLRGDAGQLLCDALPGFAHALRRGGRMVWITPSPRRTTPVAEDAGLVLDRAFDVDLGGLRARLERWLKP